MKKLVLTTVLLLAMTAVQAQSVETFLNRYKSLVEAVEQSDSISDAQRENFDTLRYDCYTDSECEKMKPIIEERGLKVKLITDVIGGKYCVSADPKMIKIVIGNFITNAIKYADTRVEIKLLGNDKRVKFMVSNDGEGISKKDIKKIWEPFYKGDKARTDRLGSSGMGLAINRSILRLHKAKYKCISDKCETSFWFEMKRVK